MFTICETCKAEFVPEDIVVSCEGLCEGQRYFHFRCVGLSYDEGCACLHRNVFWMCDSCTDAIKRDRFRKSFVERQSNEYAEKSEVDSLKSEVNRISAIVSQLTENSIAMPKESTVESPTTCNSLLSSTKLNTSDPAALSSNDTNLQLYISNIAPDVTVSEVKHMVRESLQADEVLHVKCLAPSWMDISTLNYVSFKVTVDAKFRDVAFRIANWPLGVRCREFRDLSNSVWRPTTRTTLLSS